MSQYTLEFGSYYLRDPQGKILLMTDRVAVAYDPDSFTVMKHGAPDDILKFLQTTIQKSAGLIKLSMITFPSGFDPETLNKLLDISGYLSVLIPQLEAGVTVNQ